MRRKGGGGGEDAAILDVECLISPRGYEKSHAKGAKDAKVGKGGNPTTLLTRFAEELRRAPEAGPDAGRGRRVVVGPKVSIGR